MAREIKPSVKSAVGQLFPADVPSIEERLLRVSASERVHQDILALSLGDKERFDNLCVRCEEDERNVLILEAKPEEYFTTIMRKDDAAAEFASRYELLGFTDIWRFASWGQWSKKWKKEWPNSTEPRSPSLGGSS